MEKSLESFDGHMIEIARDFRWQTDLDLGEIYPFDEVLAGYDPSAHFVDDSFQNRLAFAVLLNFPRHDARGAARARARLDAAPVGGGAPRRAVLQAHPGRASTSRSREAGAEADRYIAGYNIWMHHVVDAKGTRLFPPKMRLLSHWNLRDQIRGRLLATTNDGLAKQRQIAQVMDRIVTQTIPEVVIDNPLRRLGPGRRTRSRPSLERDSRQARAART